MLTVLTFPLRLGDLSAGVVNLHLERVKALGEEAARLQKQIDDLRAQSVSIVNQAVHAAAIMEGLDPAADMEYLSVALTKNGAFVYDKRHNAVDDNGKFVPVATFVTEVDEEELEARVVADEENGF